MSETTKGGTGVKVKSTVACKCGYQETFNSTKLAKGQLRYHLWQHLPRHFKSRVVKGSI